MSILELKGSWTRKPLCWKINLYSVTCSAFRLLDVRMPRRKKRWKTWEVLSACADTEPADAACRYRYRHIFKYQYLEHPACIRRRCRASCNDKLQTQIQQPDLSNSGQNAHQEGTRWKKTMSYIKIELISNPTGHKHKPIHNIIITSNPAQVGYQNQHLRLLFLKRRHVFLAMGCAYRRAGDRHSHGVPMVAVSANQQGAPCNIGREKCWLQYASNWGSFRNLESENASWCPPLPKIQSTIFG